MNRTTIAATLLAAGLAVAAHASGSLRPSTTHLRNTTNTSFIVARPTTAGTSLPAAEGPLAFVAFSGAIALGGGIWLTRRRS